MAKRKTQIDKAVEQLEGKKADLKAKYDADCAGFDAAITALRAQPTRKPRKAKPAPAGVGTQ